MWLILILLILYIMFDINYCIRIILTLSYGRYIQKQRKITDKSTIYGLCTTQDVDLFLTHMNNARYLRELDFARFHFYFITGIYDLCRKKGINGVQSATSIRYRRPINIFHPYKIDTRLIWWDSKNVYMEHQFITLSDGFVRSIVLSKQALSGNTFDVLNDIPEGKTTPPQPEELRLWLEGIEVSSKKLRKEK